MKTSKPRKQVELWIKQCANCKKTEEMWPTAVLCFECRPIVGRAREAIRAPAGAAVAKAVATGVLPKLDGSIMCVDCGKPAKCYDHRDYDKHLDVSPVCVSCNLKRGPAKPLVEMGLIFRGRAA